MTSPMTKGSAAASDQKLAPAERQPEVRPALAPVVLPHISLEHLASSSKEELRRNNTLPQSFIIAANPTPARLSLSEITDTRPSLLFDKAPSSLLSKDSSLSAIKQKLHEVLAQTQQNEAELRSGLLSTKTITHAAKVSEHQKRLTETINAVEAQGTRTFLPDVLSYLLDASSEELLDTYATLYDRTHDTSIPGLDDALTAASLLDVAASITRIFSLEGKNHDEYQKSLVLTALVTGNEREIFRLEESILTQQLAESFERHKSLQAEKEQALQRLEELEKRADDLKQSPFPGQSKDGLSSEQKAVTDQIVLAAAESAKLESLYQDETADLYELQTGLILARAEQFALANSGEIDTELLKSLNRLPRESWNHSPRIRELWASALYRLEQSSDSEFSEVAKVQLGEGRDAALALAIKNYRSATAVGDLYRQAETGVILREYSANAENTLQDTRIRSAAGERYASAMLPSNPQVRTKEFETSSYAELNANLSKLLYVETVPGQGRFVVADKAVRDRIAAVPEGYKAVLTRLPTAVEFRSITLGKTIEVGNEFIPGQSQKKFVADSSVIAPDLSSHAQVVRSALKPQDVVYVALESNEAGARELRVDNGFGRMTYREEDLAREAVAGSELSDLVASFKETKAAVGKGAYLYQRYVALAQKLENGMAANTKKAEWVDGVRAAATELPKLQRSGELFLVQEDLKDLSARLAATSAERPTFNQHDPAIRYIGQLSAELSRLVETKEIEKVTKFIQAPDFDPDTWGKWGRTQGVRIGTTLAAATALASIPATMGTSSPLAVAVLSGLGAYAGGEIGSALLSIDYLSYQSKLQRLAHGEMSVGNYVLESGLEIAYGAATTYTLGAVGRQLGSASRQVVTQSSSLGVKELAALSIVTGAKVFEQLERTLAKVIPGASNYTSIWTREFVEECLEEGLQGGLGAAGAAVEKEQFLVGQALKAASSSIALLSGARGRSHVSLVTGGVTLESLPDAKRFLASGIFETRFSYAQDNVEGLLKSLRAEGLQPEINPETGEVRVYRGSTELKDFGVNARHEEVYVPTKAASFMRQLVVSSQRADGSSMLSDCGFKISAGGELSVESLHTDQGVSLLSYLRRQGISVTQADGEITLTKGAESTKLSLVSEAEQTTNTATRTNVPLETLSVGGETVLGYHSGNREVFYLNSKADVAKLFAAFAKERGVGFSSGSVVAFFDKGTNRIYAAKPQPGEPREERLLRASLLAHELKHRSQSEQGKGLDEVAAYAAQAEFLARNGYEMRFTEAGYVVRRIEAEQELAEVSLPKIQGYVGQRYRVVEETVGLAAAEGPLNREQGEASGTRELNQSSQEVIDAIKTTTNAEALSEHWKGLLAQRAGNSGQRLGSYIPNVNQEQLEQMLKEATWEKYDHPQVQPPAVAYRASIPGVFNLVRLSELDPNAKITLVDGHNTKFVEATVEGEGGAPVDFVTMLVGPNEAGNVVWSFFPGEPVRPSTLPAEQLEGRTLTVEAALQMGLEWAKVDSSTNSEKASTPEAYLKSLHDDIEANSSRTFQALGLDQISDQLDSFAAAQNIPPLRDRIQRGLDPIGMLALETTSEKVQQLSNAMGVKYQDVVRVATRIQTKGPWEYADKLSSGSDGAVKVWTMLSAVNNIGNPREMKLAPGEFLSDVSRIELLLDKAIENPELFYETAKEFVVGDARKQFRVEDGVAISESDTGFIAMAVCGHQGGIIQDSDGMLFVGCEKINEAAITQLGLTSEVQIDHAGRSAILYKNAAGDTLIKQLYPGFAIVLSRNFDLAKAIATSSVEPGAESRVRTSSLAHQIYTPTSIGNAGRQSSEELSSVVLPISPYIKAKTVRDDTSIYSGPSGGEWLRSDFYDALRYAKANQIFSDLVASETKKRQEKGKPELTEEELIKLAQKVESKIEQKMDELKYMMDILRPEIARLEDGAKVIDMAGGAGDLGLAFTMEMMIAGKTPARTEIIDPFEEVATFNRLIVGELPLSEQFREIISPQIRTLQDAEITANSIVIAKHACGDLTDTIIENWVKSDSHVMCVMTCCQEKAAHNPARYNLSQGKWEDLCTSSAKTNNQNPEKRKEGMEAMTALDSARVAYLKRFGIDAVLSQTDEFPKGDVIIARREQGDK